MPTTPKHKLRVARPKKGAVKVLVGTRKGAFVIDSAPPGSYELAIETPAGTYVSD